MHEWKRTTATALALVWLSTATAAPAPETPADDPQGLFVDTVDVNLVNVEVFVTDKRGRPVTGLTRDDFELLEDGRPVELANFYAVEERRIRGRDGGTVPPEAYDPRLDAVTLPDDQRLHLVIYVDNLNLHPLNRQRGFDAIRGFLRQRLGPDDRVMVVSFERSLNERLAFTSDRERISTTLFELEDAAAEGVHASRERHALLNDIYNADDPFDVSGRVRAHAESLFAELNLSIDGLKKLVDSLAGLPGRKAVLYVSDGLPMRAGEDLFEALADKFNNQLDSLTVQDYDASRRFRSLVTQAAAHRIIFYTIDTAGLRTHGNADVLSYKGERATSVESVHVANVQDPLHYLANETGGQAIVNTNNFGDMLARVGDDFETYYSLAFAPRESGSGRYREIEVRLARGKDYKVRHREGYRDLPTGRRMADQTMAALNFGYQSNGLGIELDFGPAERTDNGRYLQPMVVRIPMAKLAFVPHQGLRRSNLRLYISAKDAQGETAPIQEVEVPIEIREEHFERALASAYQLRHTLMMEPGRQLVAVGARDEIGATSSVILSGVSVGR